jgi:hypothetical protein
MEKQVDLSALADGEWEFACSIKEAAVEDSYIGSIVKSGGQLSFKSLWRSVTLNAQPRTTETVNEIRLSNSEKVDACPFDIKAAANQNGDTMLYVDYGDVIDDNSYLYYSINNAEPPLIIDKTEKIDGKNVKVVPVIISGLSFGTPYVFQLGVLDNYGSGTRIKGIITLLLLDGKTDFSFEGNLQILQVDGYEIINY